MKLRKWCTEPVGKTLYLRKHIQETDVFDKLYSFMEGDTIIEVKVVRNFVHPKS